MGKRAHIHRRETLGEHLADWVVGAMGSWRFIVLQTVVVACWIALNGWWLTHAVDPFPFILLNLAFSTQAAYASPLILMASNRAAVRDRRRDNLEAEEVESFYALNLEQHELLGQQKQEMLLLRDVLVEVREVNVRQMEILQVLHERLGPADG
jgi:uncharacterized membrane protein